MSEAGSGICVKTLRTVRVLRPIVCMLLALTLLLCTFPTVTVSAAPPPWSDSIRVATGANYPAAVLDGKGHVHLVWVDLSDGNLRHKVVGGNETIIPSPSRSNYWPSLAADGQGRVHAVWDGGNDVYYSVWDGTCWSSPAVLPRVARSAFEAQIVLDEQNCPHVVYWSSNYTSSGYQYFPSYTRLIMGQWAQPQQLPGFVPSSTRLSFVAQEGKVHVSFLYERAGGVRSVGYTSSTDGGKSWTGLEDVAGERAPVWTSRPSLVLQEGLPVVTWASQDPQTQQLCSWYRRRSPSGWGAPMRLVQGASGQRDPVAIWDGGSLLVAWQEMVENFVQQIAVTSTDPDTGLSAPPTVFGWRGNPTMLTADVTAEGEAVVAWSTGWREVYYAYRPPFRPSSAVAPLPGVTAATSFLVRWSGVDRSGAGIKWYDVQVKDGEGPWTDWLVHTTQMSAYYAGANGHTYRFRSRATDNLGESEAWPQTCDAVTTVLVMGVQVHLPAISRQR